VWHWPHLDHIRDHLADVTLGRCHKLILTTPPQHGKSEHLTVRYPVWRMERDQRLRVGVGAYNQTHANRFSRKSRKIARVRFPLSGERKAANEWETDAGGSYVAVGVGAGITGLPIDLMVIDDPVKGRDEADSPAYQEKVYEWYMDDVTTRLQHNAPVILVMTRWNEGDLAGRILASEDGPNWRNVVLPAIALEGDPLGRRPGEALCPDLHPIEDLEGKRKVMGEGFEGLYQGNPVPRGGLFFRREWFGELVPEVPYRGGIRRVRYWDLAAATKDTSAYTSGVLMASIPRPGGADYYVEDVVRVRLPPAERNDVIRQTADADRERHGFQRTWFERQPGAAGIETAQNLIRRMAGLPVREDPITGSKQVRAEPLADAARGGTVRVCQGPWAAAYLTELASFPRGRFCDQVDSSSGAYNRLAERASGGMPSTGTWADTVHGDIMNRQF
jgi:predicted phage terminase large subunit-like protein